MFTDSVNHYISAFRFPDRADVTRHVPRFTVTNYGQSIRRLLSGSDNSSVKSPKSEVTSPALSDEIFLTPTELGPSTNNNRNGKLEKR